jgi:hypothetical protein
LYASPDRKTSAVRILPTELIVEHDGIERELNMGTIVSEGRENQLVNTVEEGEER